MLDPNQRSLYTTLLTPPPGYVLEEAIGTTFSLDIQTLLTIPVHLSMLGGEHAEDGIAVYESVRRMMDRLTLYVQRGQIRAPERGNELYGLLAPTMVEVEPSSGGVFHPKLWLLRFQPNYELTDQPTLLRLAVLSRNVTDDRSWDLSVQLEGCVGERRSEVNKPVAQLVRQLPQLACADAGQSRREQAERFAQALMHCDFQLPPGCRSIEFAVLGPELIGPRWTPKSGDRIAVISPFCSDEALQDLVGTAKQAPVLISRPETLEQLSTETCKQFDGCRVLHEAAESDDTEENVASERLGLHAKTWIIENRTRTAITLGSANATNAALVGQNNVELLVTLEGLTRELGGIDTLLGESGLGYLLQPWEKSEQTTKVDTKAEHAIQLLEDARRTITQAGLEVACEPAENADRWRLTLRGATGVVEPIEVQVWPVSKASDEAKVLDGAMEILELATLGPAHLTGILAFRLAHPDAPDVLHFALNLPVHGMPQEARDAAILHTIIHNREGFLRYVMLLLAGDDEGGCSLSAVAGMGAGGGWRRGFSDDLPLLEELTRCYSREPERLHDVARMIERLRARAAGIDNVIPEEFDTVWAVYEQALERRNG